MNRTTSAIAALCLATLTGAGLALAGPGCPHGRHERGDFGGEGPGLGHGLMGLDLSDQQRDQVRDVMTRSREQHAPLREALGKARGELRDAATADPVDEAAVRAAAASLASAEADLALALGRTRIELRRLLSDEQIRKLDEIKEQREDSHPRRELRERMREHRRERHDEPRKGADTDL